MQELFFIFLFAIKQGVVFANDTDNIVLLLQYCNEFLTMDVAEAFD